MSSAQVENEFVALALEDKAEIEAATTFHKGGNSTQAESRVQMGEAEGITSRYHGGKYFRLTLLRDGFPKPSCGAKRDHRSSGPSIVLRWP